MSGRRGLNLSAAQVIASVLATLSAAVAASFLGVAGTLLGAALGSVFSTMGTEIYKHYLQRSEERLRTAGQVLYHSAAKTKTGDTQATRRPRRERLPAGGTPRTRVRRVSKVRPGSWGIAMWPAKTRRTRKRPSGTAGNTAPRGIRTKPRRSRAPVPSGAVPRTAGSPTVAHRTAGQRTVAPRTAGTARLTAPASTRTGASPRKGRTATQRAVAACGPRSPASSAA